MSQQTCPDKFSQNWQIALSCAYKNALAKYIELYPQASKESTTMGDDFFTFGITGFNANSKFAKEMKLFIKQSGVSGDYDIKSRYIHSAHFKFYFNHDPSLPSNMLRPVINVSWFNKAVLNEFVKALQDMGVPGSEKLSVNVVYSYSY